MVNKPLDEVVNEIAEKCQNTVFLVDETNIEEAEKLKCKAEIILCGNLFNDSEYVPEILSPEFNRKRISGTYFLKGEICLDEAKYEKECVEPLENLKNRDIREFVIIESGEYLSSSLWRLIVEAYLEQIKAAERVKILSVYKHNNGREYVCEPYESEIIGAHDAYVSLFCRCEKIDLVKFGIIESNVDSYLDIIELLKG